VFKTESPFDDGAGAPGSPIVATSSSTGFQTKLHTLKTIATTRKAFPYTVTFVSGATDDPEVIIDNSSGGGGGGGGSAKKKKKKR
jgi:hypothetical protein